MSEGIREQISLFTFEFPAEESDRYESGGDGGFSQVGCVGFTFKHMINYVDINKSDSPPRRREHVGEAGSPTLEQFLFASRHSGGWSLKCVEEEYIEMLGFGCGIVF